jgi:hypothetical protein
VIPQGAYTTGKYYIVDGFSIVQLDVATDTVEAYTASAGSAPTGCKIACVFRDRLYLGAPLGNEQNFFASRVGDHHDWNYGAEDIGAAFDGNASLSGRIGNPLVAFIPLGDDELGLFGDHDCHVLRGDPADNGTIDLISDAIGILGPKAWTKSPDGTVYFLGTGGLFKWNAGSNPVNISSNSYNQVFANIDRSNTVVTLVWERDLHGMHIFLYRTGQTISTAPTHLWYEERTSSIEDGAALFPEEFPIGHGPVTAIVYDGDGPLDRVTLLGGRDGYLRQLDSTAVNDDSTAIASFVLLGPFPLGDTYNDGVMSNVVLTFGEPPDGFTDSDLEVEVILRGGLTAFDVTEGRADAGTKLHTITRTYAGVSGRATPIVGKVRGAWGSIELRCNTLGKLYAFESVSYKILPGGTTRR